MRRPDRVESARRLVEEKEWRRSDERLRDPQALLHPLGHRGDAAAALGAARRAEQLAPLGRRRPRRGKPLVQRQHLVGAQQPGKRTARRGSRASAAPRDPAGAPQPRPRRRRRAQPAGDLDERRLPGAVRPEQPDELPGAHVESTPSSAWTGRTASRAPSQPGRAARRKPYQRCQTPLGVRHRFLFDG